MHNSRWPLENIGDWNNGNCAGKERALHTVHVSRSLVFLVSEGVSEDDFNLSLTRTRTEWLHINKT